MATRYSTSEGGMFTAYTDAERAMFAAAYPDKMESNVGRIFKTKLGASVKLVSEYEANGKVYEVWESAGIKKTFSHAYFIESSKVYNWANKVNGL